MLGAVYNSYRALADQIEWTKYGPNELFIECIKHENDQLYENFFAAIICRFWGHSGRIYVQCNRHVPFEECYDCIINAALYVLKNRVWENVNSSLYNDPTGPDKAMHIAIKRERSIMLSRHNAKKRLSNFNTISIDDAHESYSDAADGLLFGLIDGNDSVNRLINSYFTSYSTYLEGLILDSICYNCKSEFKYNDIIKELRLITFNNLDRYVMLYCADINNLKSTLNEIRTMSNKLLEIRIKSLLHNLEEEFTSGGSKINEFSM